MFKKKKAKREARKKSNVEKNIEASSISVQKMAVLATIISVVVGGLSGYLGSHLQTKMLKSIKMDDIARSMVEADLAQMKQLGTSSYYSPIAHYVVNRRILEDFDVSKPISIEKLRKETENAMNVCMENRRVMSLSYTARMAHQTFRSVRDDVEKYYNHIDGLPDTPEFNKYKNMLRTFAIGEIRRLDKLQNMSDEQEPNRIHDPWPVAKQAWPVADGGLNGVNVGWNAPFEAWNDADEAWNEAL